jgi:parvulin-like peptidyl-prolyl isomerase
MTLPVRNLIPLLFVCALALTVAACGGDEDRTAEDVPADAIALVGDTEIPRAEFDELMKRAEVNYKAQKREFPAAGSPEYQDLKTRAVAFLVQKYQFRAEAEKLGVEASEEEVDKKFDELKQQAFGGDEKKFQAALKKEGLTEEQAREEIEDRVLQEELYTKVTENAKVSEKDITDYYEKNKQQFTQPASRDVRQILIACDAKKAAKCQEAKATADDLYAQLQSGASFAQLARQHSTDTSTAKTGGKLPVTKGSTVPPFDKQAFSLEVGAFSTPFKTQFGWHIVKADGPVKPERATPLEEVKESIKQQLEQTEKNEALEKWLKDLEKRYERETVFAAGFEPEKTELATTGATTTQK